MNKAQKQQIERARQAALEVLLHNLHGPYRGLPRTAGWGYPEPYTRDLMISSLGMLASDHPKLTEGVRKTLEALARSQSSLGHIPSLAHDRQDRGASDCTPLFLIGAALYRRKTGQPDFLAEAVDKACTWMQYQSPEDRVLVGQLPTSDWRDEQWVLGYGLFVNTLVYTYLRLLGCNKRAEQLRAEMAHFAILASRRHRHVHEGLVLHRKPYYAFWSYKIYSSERFDLLGNSLAILSGIATPSRAKSMIAWIEYECRNLRRMGHLVGDLPPNFFPYVLPDDPDWRPRYATYNMPGDYHNGGIWPFICGFYVAALVAAGRTTLARKKLLALTELVRPAREAEVEFGFNEWIKAQTGRPMGQDWQTWSAAMYLYAAACVEQQQTPFFEEIRTRHIKESE